MIALLKFEHVYWVVVVQHAKYSTTRSPTPIRLGYFLNIKMKRFYLSLFLMLRVILNKSWKEHPTRQQSYDHLPLITKNIQVTRTTPAGHLSKGKERTHKKRFGMYPFAWMCLSWSTNNNLSTTTLYGHRVLSRRPAESDEWWVWMARESLGNLC